MQRPWYAIQNKPDDASVTDIHIIDLIGGWDEDWIARNWGLQMGVTARAFVEDLANLAATVKTIRVHINSPGGDVQGGVNIANALREQQLSKGRTVETYVDGIAASAASIIAMAGSKVHMADNALMMVHNPWTVSVGNAAEMRKVADILDTIRGQIIATYQWHSTLDADDLADLMDDETWMDADEAIANGFATDRVEGLQAAAAIDRGARAILNVPEKYRARVDHFFAPVPEPAPEPKALNAADVLARCREQGCPDLGEQLIAAASWEVVDARIAEVKAERATAQARADEITALCATAKQSDLAATFIAGGMSVQGVRDALVAFTAKLDKVEIDGSLTPATGKKPHGRRPSMNPNAMFES